MTPQEEKEFKEMVAKDCRRMARQHILSWAGMAIYLEDEFNEGKNEFRLFVNSDKSFYIHPLGKDGKTFDGKL